MHDALEPAERSAAAEPLDRAARALQAHFDMSNFAVEMDQCYLDLVADACTAMAGDCAVIVLAQASMARMTERPPFEIPVLSSPPLAVEAAARSFS